VTEKIDGTNAQIYITDAGDFCVGSRNRWLTPDSDNYGFARWAYDNREELMRLGPGQHFGEWWGCGIQRRYGMKEKVFSLFDTNRWAQKHSRRLPLMGYNLLSEETQQYPPDCCEVVPELYRGEFKTDVIDMVLENLERSGSLAADGFDRPEGIIVKHWETGVMFKKTLDNDGHKSTGSR